MLTTPTVPSRSQSRGIESTATHNHHLLVRPTTPRSQRLFTEGDELRLLKSLYRIIKSTNASALPIDYQTIASVRDTAGQEFTAAQIANKLQKLRQKYRKQSRTKSLIKSHHDRRVFEIARKIWGAKESSTRDKRDLDHSNCAEIVEHPESLDAEVEKVSNSEGRKVDLENYTALLGEFSRWFPGNAVWREGMRCMEERELREMNEKWMLLQIEEAKMVARKAELVQEQIRVTLESGSLGHS